MNKDELKNLIIYTSIYYQNDPIYDARIKIWPKMFENAEKLGIPVVVRNNGGVPEELLQMIKQFNNVTIIDKVLDKNPQDTRGDGMREALRKAQEIGRERGIENPIFLWTEPEKDDLITEKNLLPLVSEIKNGSNIVIPDRGEVAWNQLPKIQSFLENRAQGKVEDIVEKISHGKNKEKLDMWFGPKVFDEVGADYFLKYNTNKDRTDMWDAIMVPVAEAIKDGIPVKSIPIDFSYNEIQIESESNEASGEIGTKRLEQYAQILKEMGDTKWVDFFESSKEELKRLQELQKQKPPVDLEVLKEAKKSFVQKFFKLK